MCWLLFGFRDITGKRCRPHSRVILSLSKDLVPEQISFEVTPVVDRGSERGRDRARNDGMLRLRDQDDT
jgi:hypothetical protein